MKRRYFLFEAALITLSNQFSPVAGDPTAHVSIRSAINIMEYFSVEDEQARRLLDILTCFYDVVRQRSSPPKLENSPDKTTRTFSSSGSTSQEEGPKRPLPPSRRASVRSGRDVFKQAISDPNVSPTTSFRSNLLASTGTSNINQQSSLQNPKQTIHRRNSAGAYLEFPKSTSNRSGTLRVNSVEGNDLLAEESEVDLSQLWNWPTTDNHGTVRPSVAAQSSGDKPAAPRTSLTGGASDPT